MSEFPYYLSFVVTFMACLMSIIKVKKELNSGFFDIEVAIKQVLMLTTLFGVLGGTLFFQVLSWLFAQFGLSVGLGHGEILITAAFYNLLLGFAFAIIGIVVLTWKN